MKNKNLLPDTICLKNMCNGSYNSTNINFIIENGCEINHECMINLFLNRRKYYYKQNKVDDHKIIQSYNNFIKNDKNKYIKKIKELEKKLQKYENQDIDCIDNELISDDINNSKKIIFIK